jgi:hypothetical protein
MLALGASSSQGAAHTLGTLSHVGSTHMLVTELCLHPMDIRATHALTKGLKTLAYYFMPTSIFFVAILTTCLYIHCLLLTVANLLG